MSGSFVIVAVNARMLRRVRLQSREVVARSPPALGMSLPQVQTSATKSTSRT